MTDKTNRSTVSTEDDETLALQADRVEGEAVTVSVQRPRRVPIAPPSDAQQDGGSTGVVVSRNWALGLRSVKAKKESGLTRQREIAGDLPEWSPLPPGELAVGRTTGRHR